MWSNSTFQVSGQIQQVFEWLLFWDICCCEYAKPVWNETWWNVDSACFLGINVRSTLSVISTRESPHSVREINKLQNTNNNEMESSKLPLPQCLRHGFFSYFPNSVVILVPQISFFLTNVPVWTEEGKRWRCSRKRHLNFPSNLFCPQPSTKWRDVACCGEVEEIFFPTFRKNFQLIFRDDKLLVITEFVQKYHLSRRNGHFFFLLS